MKSVLDLGCGYGENCAEFKARGARAVLGVDISEKMLEVATQEHPDIEFIRADISDLSFIKEKYDVVFSSLAVHYVEDFAAFTRGVYDVLNPGGYFIFSQEHPLTTAPIAGAGWFRDDDGNVLHYKLTDYARGGKRSTKWFVEGVRKYHRTFSEIILQIPATFARATNSNLTLPIPENHKSSSLSKSKTPEVSTENA